MESGTLPKEMPIDTFNVVLDKVRAELKVHLSPALLDETIIEARADSLADTIMANFEVWLWSNMIHSETRREFFPETWWDGFKQAYFPNFLRRKMPVRTKQVFVETKTFHVCPHLDIRTRDDQAVHLAFMSRPGEITRLQGK